MAKRVLNSNPSDGDKMEPKIEEVEPESRVMSDSGLVIQMLLISVMPLLMVMWHA